MDNVVYHQDHSFLPMKEQGRVFHGFFTRQGGVSGGVCSGLNCGLGSADHPDHVQENRSFVAAHAGVAAHALLSAYQVHGRDCLYITQGWDVHNRPKADAMVTDKPGLALGILTADCAPVLFHGTKGDGSPVIGAAHAGWKGALGGVLAETLKNMQEIGVLPETIKACVGPCIGRMSYEVSEPFIFPFLEENEESERFFKSARRSEHVMFDLGGYCAWRLHRAGVSAVAIIDKDTYAREDEFFSFRRATHRKEPDYGRQISVIAIRS